MNKKEIQQPTDSQHVNPFLVPYNTPHNTPPFGQFDLQDVEEAMMEGMRRDKEALEKMLANPEEPTFDNTLLYKDEEKPKGYYDVLDHVTTMFFNLLSADGNDDMQALAQKMMPLLTQHANDISLDPRMFERLKKVKAHHRELTPEEDRLLENAYKGYIRSGALLDEAGKKRFRELTDEQSRLSLQFSQNVLKATKAFQLHLTQEEELDGLPEREREAALSLAKEEEKEGWIITLDDPSYGPFMRYSTRRDLREKLYKAKVTLCTTGNECNIDICKRLINNRREVAQLLGYDTFADFVMEYRMASSSKNVYKLLDDLIEAYKPTADIEHQDVVDLAKEIEGQDFEPKAWDSAYYSYKLQLRRFDLDPDMLRPYFEVKNVIKGVFGLATRLYGITFKENKDIPVYHPDVCPYEVFDRDGSYLAVLFVDFFPRKGKRGGAWMTEYQGQWIKKDGTNVRPHVSLVMNFSKPTADKPALLRLGEVETFLHEFGHALHAIFSNTRFESLSTTNVWWDFVELPSQFMENYAYERDFLRTFAFHYETGEPLPDELLERVIKSRNFCVASACLRQVGFGLIDMAYYTRKNAFEEDLIPFEHEVLKGITNNKPLPQQCMTTHFSHIMAGGYAAGYYSYKWAEVLETDAFSAFQEHGIFNQETAQRFRDCILSRGGTEHPMVLYKNFRGHEPTIDAMLRRDGITTAKSEGDSETHQFLER